MGFTELGHEVVKVTLRQGEKGIVREIRKHNPDLVIFHKMSDKSPWVTKEISRKYRTWFWFADLFQVVRNGEENIIQNARNCHYRSCPSPIPAKQLREKTGKDVHIIPNVTPVTLGYTRAHGVEQTTDYGFLGTKTKWRQKSLTAICHGHTLLCHGGGYPKGKVNGPSWSEAVAKTRIQINIPQYERWPATLSSRSYRILSCGGLLLSQWSEDFEGMLKSDEHFVAFKNAKDGRAKGEYYLKHETERREIARRGERFVMENYLPVHVAQKMLEVVNGS